MKVRVVTDSTSDLPPEVARDLGITVVPAQVQFGDQVFLDGIELTSEEFYRRLQSESTLPKTSPASISTFNSTYRRIAEEADGIISIHVVAKLSVTYDIARQASADVKCPVIVIDSQTASMACGLLAIIAAKAARAGESLTEIEKLVRQAIPCTVTYGVFGTLEYLAKGGRIGKGQAFLGTLLKINPILAIRMSEVVPVERVRTRSRAVERMCEMVCGHAPLRELSVMRTTNPEEAEEVIRRLSPVFPPERMYRASIGPSMGTQVGPNAVGVALIAEKPLQ
ncbi:MAG: DegV family protein [Dehalococcoidia bacterium]|nr:DegV family protein [Dehalococcoidia bacterium]